MATKPTDHATDHPDYYGGADNPYEVIKVIEAWGLDKDSYLMTAVIYLSRAGKKDNEGYDADVGKAIWWLNRRREQLAKEQEVAHKEEVRPGMHDALKTIWEPELQRQQKEADHPTRFSVLNTTPSNVQALSGEDEGRVMMATQIDNERMIEIMQQALMAVKGSEVVAVHATPDGSWLIDYKTPRLTMDAHCIDCGAGQFDPHDAACTVRTGPTLYG